MTSTVLVIGAQGVLGTFIAQEFAAAGWQVTRAGRRPEDAADFRPIDLDDPASLGRACAGVDLLINTAHHRELGPERTVLHQGGTLIDLIELTPAERMQLASDGAEGPGLVVTDTGLGGVAYLAIAEMLREHPEADSAEYSLMSSASGSSGRAGALFAHRLLTGSSHHQTKVVAFPEPFGRRRCLRVGVDRDSVFRNRIGEVPLRHYICMQPRPLHGILLALNSVRLIGVMPTASFTAGKRKVPSQLSEEPICEWVSVSRDGRPLAVQTLEGQGYYRMTVAATLAFAETLVESHGSGHGKRGLHRLDDVLTLADVRPTIEQRGIAITKRAESSAARGA